MDEITNISQVTDNTTDPAEVVNSNVVVTKVNDPFIPPKPIVKIYNNIWCCSRCNCCRFRKFFHYKNHCRIIRKRWCNNQNYFKISIINKNCRRNTSNRTSSR